MAASRGFGSDNQSGIHPAALAAIAQANEGHVVSYGDDPHSARACALLRAELGEEHEVLLALTGTGANVVGLAAVLRPFEAVVCADHAHIAVDECGAPERFVGVKLLTVPTTDGKLTPAMVEPLLRGFGVEHHAQPRVISVSQPTELGTVYRPAELRALAELAHRRGLLLHLDGARLANAAAFLGTSLREASAAADVDVLSFGGTKNGLMCGEAVLVRGGADRGAARFVHKQATQLASKMRFVAAQLVALLEHELWRELATHANDMAQQLAKRAAAVAGVQLTQAVEANEVFALVPAGWIAPLQARWPFYVWDERRHEVRWVCSWDTRPEDVAGLCADLEACGAGRPG